MGASFTASGMRIQSVVWATMLEEMEENSEANGRMLSSMAEVDILGQTASPSRDSTWTTKNKVLASSAGGIVDATKDGGVKEKCMAMESLTKPMET
mmetsp:Transcript_33400/g.76283  ORF Transcript_33400/g.76283 Transcript_33400/m.76283 type:complete len:96 (-) Transcript_33400:131-418(-)